jgi:hypothetical protein
MLKFAVMDCFTSPFFIMANLNSDDIKLISNFISSQRIKAVETFTEKTVKYSDTIKKHRDIKAIS